MSQTTRGAGGGIHFIEPSDLQQPPRDEVEEETTLNPLREFGRHSSTPSKEEKTVRTTFESTLKDWVMAFKPQTVAHPAYVLAYVKWWLYTRLRLFKYDWITPPSTLVDIKGEIQANTRLTNDFRSQLHGIVSVFQIKGGSAKSTVIDWLAADTARSTKLNPGLIGLDIGADKTESRFRLLGVKILSAAELIEWVKNQRPFTVRDLENATSTDAATGLMLFKALRENESKSVRDFSKSDTAEMLRIVNTQRPLLFCDTGPGNNQVATDGVAEVTDVALVTNRGMAEEEFNDIRKTIDRDSYGLSSKTIKPIVVISDVPHRKLNTRTQYFVARSCGVDPENVILIPHDKYLATKKFVNMTSLSSHTELMLGRLKKRLVEVIVGEEVVKQHHPRVRA